MQFCKICKEYVSDGIPLSDGGIVHKSCLDAIQGKEENVNNKIYTLRNELNRLRDEIKRREGLGFKIVSIFTRPKIDTIEIEKKIQRIERNIIKLSDSLLFIRVEAALIYDYFLTYPPDWEERQRQVVDRDGEQCNKCGNWSQLHLHHIKPLSKGGSNKITNLILLCKNCHSKEHSGRDFYSEFAKHETAFSKRVANICYAIENGKRIKFGYRKPTEKSYKQRTVKPIELINVDHWRDNGSTLCARGYCELRKADRTFALKRMRGLKVI